VAGRGIHSGGSLMMLALGFKEVTSTHTAGRSQKTAQAIMTTVRSGRREGMAQYWV
jgi:hypothetical protein